MGRSIFGYDRRVMSSASPWKKDKVSSRPALDKTLWSNPKRLPAFVDAVFERMEKFREDLGHLSKKILAAKENNLTQQDARLKAILNEYVKLKEVILVFQKLLFPKISQNIHMLSPAQQEQFSAENIKLFFKAFDLVSDFFSPYMAAEEKSFDKSEEMSPLMSVTPMQSLVMMK